jgi:hypothetical protein
MVHLNLHSPLPIHGHLAPMSYVVLIRVFIFLFFYQTLIGHCIVVGTSINCSTLNDHLSHGLIQSLQHQAIALHTVTNNFIA